MDIKFGIVMENHAYRFQQITFSINISTLDGQMKILKINYFNLYLRLSDNDMTPA